MQTIGVSLTESVHAEGSIMEDEIKTAETEQGDATGKGESSVDVSNNTPAKRARGRPKGSKKLQVCVTDVNLMDLVPSISNGGSPPPKRERGRPKLLVTKTILLKESQSQTPRKRGRPKGSFKKKPGITDSPESKADGEVQEVTVVKPRKRTTDNADLKSEAENITDEEGDTCTVVAPRKRGRPKGSLNKTPRLTRTNDTSLPKRGRGRPRKEGKVKQENGISALPPRGRGRPRKVRSEDEQRQAADGPPPVKRGRGRPKGSLNKKPTVYLPSPESSGERPRRESVPPCRLEGAIPSKKGKRGRPRKHPGQRGRPRKYPLPSPSELKKPKVWKPLGRPRKYPRVDPPEGSVPAPRRSRGRPRKSETKKGAHLRKNPLATPSSELPRKSSTAGGDGPPRKRGRPKGSVNKNKARKEPPPDDSADVVLIEEEEVQQGVEMEPVEEGEQAEETVIDQDANFEVSNQA